VYIHKNDPGLHEGPVASSEVQSDTNFFIALMLYIFACGDKAPMVAVIGEKSMKEEDFFLHCVRGLWNATNHSVDGFIFTALVEQVVQGCGNITPSIA